jgi:hypothetical protein
MARRVVFSDPETGRFVSAADAGDLDQYLRRVYVDNVLSESVLYQDGIPQIDFLAPAEENWREEETQWGVTFRNDENDLSLGALQTAEPPEGATAFRVRYNVALNPDYPQGYASGAWMGMEQWPPSLEALENVSPTGIAMIHFDVR